MAACIVEGDALSETVMQYFDSPSSAMTSGFGFFATGLEIGSAMGFCSKDAFFSAGGSRRTCCGPQRTENARTAPHRKGHNQKKRVSGCP